MTKEIGLSISLRETSTSFNAALKSLEIDDFVTLSGQPLGILEPSLQSRTQGVNFAQVEVDLNPIDSEEKLDLRVKVRIIFPSTNGVVFFFFGDLKCYFFGD